MRLCSCLRETLLSAVSRGHTLMRESISRSIASISHDVGSLPNLLVNRLFLNLRTFHGDAQLQSMRVTGAASGLSGTTPQTLESFGAPTDTTTSHTDRRSHSGVADADET